MRELIFLKIKLESADLIITKSMKTKHKLMTIIVNLYEVEFTLNAFAGYDHITVLIHPSLASQNIVHTCCNLLPMIFLVVPVVIHNYFVNTF